MNEGKKEENINQKDETENEAVKCQKERDEYLDGWKRAKAELINYKKDEAKRFEEIIKFSREGLIGELINVLDSFDLALISLEADADHKTQKGFYLIRTQLEDVLRKNGLEKMIVSIGQSFDPGFHEAIVSVESDKPAGTIIEEVEKGYLLHGKLIRPARVKVAK
ncbi:nucleotide exchange factor GrpE [Candidatus Wolfebacteria bacterium]|nr:nucleotide exchange factor GrpE [Candidatus Wolfebacteria bacterium]